MQIRAFRVCYVHFTAVPVRTGEVEWQCATFQVNHFANEKETQSSSSRSVKAFETQTRAITNNVFIHETYIHFLLLSLRFKGHDSHHSSSFPHNTVPSGISHLAITFSEFFQTQRRRPQYPKRWTLIMISSLQTTSTPKHLRHKSSCTSYQLGILQAATCFGKWSSTSTS